MKIQINISNEVDLKTLIETLLAAAVNFSVERNEDEILVIAESHEEYRLRAIVKMNSRIIFGEWKDLDQSTFEDMIIS